MQTSTSIHDIENPFCSKNSIISKQTEQPHSLSLVFVFCFPPRQHVNPIDYKQKTLSHRQCQSSDANDYRFSSLLTPEKKNSKIKKFKLSFFTRKKFAFEKSERIERNNRMKRKSFPTINNSPFVRKIKLKSVSLCQKFAVNFPFAAHLFTVVKFLTSASGKLCYSFVLFFTNFMEQKR